MGTKNEKIVAKAPIAPQPERRTAPVVEQGPDAEKAAADKAKADQEAADKAKVDQEAADKAKADQEAADKAKADQEAADKAKADASATLSNQGESVDEFVGAFAEQLKAEKDEKLKKQAEKKAERDAAIKAKNPRVKDAEALIS